MNQFELAKKLFIEGLGFLIAEEYENAEQKLREAHRLVPDRISVLTNLSAALLKQDKVAESKKYAEMSVERDDKNAEGWLNLGSCLKKECNFTPALESYDKAIALKPDYAEAWSNRGLALKDLKRFDEALASCDKAIALKPDFAEAWVSRGITLNDLKRFDEALASYDKAMALKENMPYVFGEWLLAKMHLCHWEGLELAYDKLTKAIEAGDKVSSNVLAIPSSLAQQRRCAEIYIQDKYPISSYLPRLEGRYLHNRIKIGYFSAD